MGREPCGLGYPAAHAIPLLTRLATDLVEARVDVATAYAHTIFGDGCEVGTGATVSD